MRVWYLLAALAFAMPACGGGNQNQVIEPSGPPPLPPASGTAIGYLVDAKRDLNLTDEQFAKLQEIDESLAARNGPIDVQLREIEKPVPAEQLTPQQVKAGEKEPRYNNAPGASTIVTEDSLRLRKMREANDRDAIERALALLDPEQVVKAKRILQDRGIQVPDGAGPQPTHTAEDGTPLPGMEP